MGTRPWEFDSPRLHQERAPCAPPRPPGGPAAEWRVDRDRAAVTPAQELPITEDPQLLLSIAEASAWATATYGREISESNISYLLQYGKVGRHDEGGRTRVSRSELERYYETHLQERPRALKERLGEDLNWRLSFDELRERDTTRHVHRLHPYKGKFIPQLVEYFLDEHTDEFKRVACFRPGDVVLDPFCGSGTTLVQASELGLHAVGIDVSAFNAQISNGKLSRPDAAALQAAAAALTQSLQSHWQASPVRALDRQLDAAMRDYNLTHFPPRSMRRQMVEGVVDERVYGPAQESAFAAIYEDLVTASGLHFAPGEGGFCDRWFAAPVGAEIALLAGEIANLPPELRELFQLVLTRTMRSVRATTHFDLGTLKEPVSRPYYCFKHKKICRPILSMQRSWRRYARDTIARLAEFQALRTPTRQRCLVGDSRSLDVLAALRAEEPELAGIVAAQGIRGVFSSPPYVGVIDYHEQHAYAYELLGLPRRDDAEIGPLFEGTGRAAQASYVAGIAAVLANCLRVLAPDCDVFLVANDRHGLYPAIAEAAGMTIVTTYRRPVLNRSERDSGAYAETIFHLKRAGQTLPRVQGELFGEPES